MRRIARVPLLVGTIGVMAQLLPGAVAAPQLRNLLSPGNAQPTAESAPTATTEAAAPQEPTPPRPIPMAQRARAEDEAMARLQAITARLSPNTDETTILAEIERKEEEIARLRRQLEAAPIESIPPRALEDERQTWLRQSAEVERWQGALEHGATALEQDQAEVHAMGELWNTTFLAATAEGVPTVVLDRIAAVRAAAAETEARYRERFDAILILQYRVAQLRAIVAQELAVLDRAAVAVRQALFQVESVPLWAAFGKARRPATVAAEILDSWRGIATDVRFFLREESGRFLLQVAIFAALAAGIAALRRRGKHWLASSDPAAPTAEIILSRPFSSAAHIALLLTIWIYAAPPASVFHLMGILLLFPFFRLLPGLVEKQLHPPLYGLAAIWAIERFRDLVVPHSLLHRLLLLSSAAIGLAGAVYSLRPGGPARAHRGRGWWRLSIGAAALGGALLAAAAVSNVLGNVTLADVLTNGTLGSAFLAVLLFAATKILEAMAAVPLRSPLVSGLRSLRDRSDVLMQRWHAAVQAVSFAVWVYVTLHLFRVWDGTVAIVSSVLAKRLLLGTINLSVGNVVAFMAAIALAIAVAKTLRIILDDALLPGLDLPRGVPAAVSKTVQYTVVGFGIVLAFMAGGLDVGKFGFLLGALGVGIGFGLQNVVNNFVSGIILIYERPIQEGDVIQAGTVMGQVQRIGIRSSTVRTFDGAEVVFPNASLISSEVTNWTLSDRKSRAELTIGVAYGSDPRRVLEILRGVATDRPGVLSRPAPVVLFTGLGESSLDFALRFWTPDFQEMLETKSAVLADIYAALGEAGIAIPFPQRDLHVRSVDIEAAKALARGDTTGVS